MKIKSINVITMFNGVVDSMDSFTDDEAGNKEAEACFADNIKDTGYEMDDEDIQACIEEGYFDCPKNEILLIHSN